MTPMLSVRVWVTALVLTSAMPHLAAAQPTSTPRPIPGFVGCSVLFAAPTALAVGDFNQDGNPDIAVVSKSSSSVTVILTDLTHFAHGECLQATAHTTSFGVTGAAAIAAG